MPDCASFELPYLLDRQRDTLDRAFGEDGYEIRSDHADQVTITTKHLKIKFALERDGELGALVSLREAPNATATVADVSLWARFLRVEAPPKCRDKNGRALKSTEDQLRATLEVVAHFQKQILADKHTARDAAVFMEGYTLAYSDWATGKS